MDLLEKVKKRLEKYYDYDFQSDFWLDEGKVFLEEIVQATKEEMTEPARFELDIPKWLPSIAFNSAKREYANGYKLKAIQVIHEHAKGQVKNPIEWSRVFTRIHFSNS